MADGTPLPSALSGVTKQRVIEIDNALFYLVGGALNWLANIEPLEQTGTLTESDARIALNGMLTRFYEENVTLMVIGAIMMWWSASIPDKWLLLGGGAISKTTYPELFAIFGYTYGGGGDTFLLPTMKGFSPYGAGASIALGNSGGADTHNLSIAELPAHSHSVNDPGHFHRIQKASATVNAGVNTSTPNARSDNPAAPDMVTDSKATGITIANTGSNAAFSLLHPVKAVNFIIYAGH